MQYLKLFSPFDIRHWRMCRKAHEIKETVLTDTL